MLQIYTGLHCSKLKWLPMPFGSYKRYTIPDIFMQNPGYPSYLSESEIIRTNFAYGRELSRQVELVVSRGQRILVAKAPRDAYEFLVLIDDQGIFARVVTVKKGTRMPDRFTGNTQLTVDARF